MLAVASLPVMFAGLGFAIAGHSEIGIALALAGTGFLVVYFVALIFNTRKILPDGPH